MKEFVRNYFVAAAKILGETIVEYLNNAKCYYVILEGEDVVVWRKENTPVIFGSMDEVADELSNWATPIKNISILTEQDFINQYCGKEKDIALLAEKKAEQEKEFCYHYPMDTTNGHNPKLVNTINKLWAEHLPRFGYILTALYKRDFEEIYNADSFSDLPEDTDAALSTLLINWENYAANYLQHIADDGDLETIINFMRRNVD